MIGLKSNTTIGLDIGFNSIKIIEYHPRKKNNVVDRLIVEPTGLLPSMSEEERNEQLVEVLRDAWKKHGLKSKRIHAVISGRQAFYRPLRIPVVTGDRLEKIVRYEAKQQIPFPLDQVLLNHHIFGGKGGELEGALIAVRQQTVEDYAKLLSRAGLRPDVIEISLLSIFNSIRALEKDQEEVIGVVNIGATTTDIVIEQDDALKFGRSTAVGGNDLTAAIAKATETEFAEAEQIKSNYGRLSTSDESLFDQAPESITDHVDETTVVTALDTAMERVVTEVRRTIDYYISQPDGMAVSRLLISGGTSSLPGIAPFFEERLGIPVEKVNLTQSSPAVLEKAIDEQNEDVALIASGMAVPDIVPNRVSMNFIPPSIQYKQEFEQKRGYIFVQVVFIGILIAVVFMFLDRYQQYRAKTLKDVKAVIEIDRTVIGEEFARVRQAQQEMRERIGLLSQIGEQRGQVMANLLEIVRVTPEEQVSITSVDVEQDQIKVRGKAIDDEGVKSFSEKLRLSPFVQEFRIALDEGSGFVITITKLHEPNERENNFYELIWPRRMELENLRDFRFGRPKAPGHVIFSFYENSLEQLSEQFLVILSVFRETEIEFDRLTFRVLDFTEQPVYNIDIFDEATVLKLIHGELDMLEFLEENRKMVEA